MAAKFTILDGHGNNLASKWIEGGGMVESTILNTISALLFCKVDKNKNISTIVVQDKHQLTGEYSYTHYYPVSRKEFIELIESKKCETLQFLYKTLYVFRLLSK